eukprot:5730281-Amphidinium_carterae.5
MDVNTLNGRRKHPLATRGRSHSYAIGSMHSSPHHESDCMEQQYLRGIGDTEPHERRQLAENRALEKAPVSNYRMSGSPSICFTSLAARKSFAAISEPIQTVRIESRIIPGCFCDAPQPSLLSSSLCSHWCTKSGGSTTFWP